MFGATGSGKTSGSGRTIAKAMLAEGFGGLVLTAKPDERELWERYCRETGRLESLYVFDHARGSAFNFLDYELKRPTAGSGLTANIVALFMNVLDAAGRETGGGGGAGLSDAFWDRALQQLLRNAVDLLVMARGTLTLAEIARVIATAPTSEEAARDPQWQERSFCFECLRSANRKHGNAGDPRLHDLDITTTYWLSEFAGLAERTRSSIVATFTSLADGLMRGPMREMFCTGTTVVPELTHHGAVIVLDLPVKHYQDLGRAAQVIFKTCWQKATEARDAGGETRPVFLWADEAQNFVTRHDASFQATARSAKACTVYLTQNLPNYVAALGGSDAKANADAFVGNLQTKIFHANGDGETNEWAERLFGKRWGWRTNTSTSSQPKKDDHFGARDNSSTAGASESFDTEVPAGEFTRLTKGGPANRFLVEGIVFQGGRTWRATGANHVRASFDQRR